MCVTVHSTQGLYQLTVWGILPCPFCRQEPEAQRGKGSGQWHSAEEKVSQAQAVTGSSGPSGATTRMAGTKDFHGDTLGELTKHLLIGALQMQSCLIWQDTPRASLTSPLLMHDGDEGRRAQGGSISSQEGMEP